MNHVNKEVENRPGKAYINNGLAVKPRESAADYMKYGRIAGRPHVIEYVSWSDAM
jgi:hypothetical protein